ncbi:pre-piRNA 3'-exonuclease trimmer isoform X2 [Leptinotarsa decemlineata]|uniref:pre-piRNA 3'-exonuclease trimmer isoform X2 n=1 Tax=Leptinotarsa decemlineata TaxID=7539 RepID=UPI003D305B6B
MCRTDINIINFKEKFPEIKRSLEDARFISFDLEFSALYPLKEYSPSIFDTPSERYRKLRKIMEHVVPIQIGITAFTCDLTDNCFRGKIYNFYLLPPSFPTIHKNFLFDPGAVKFLAFHGFDFNQKLDGDDPKPIKPPFLVLQSNIKRNLSIYQVSNMLSGLGFFEIRTFPFHRGRYLIATDNDQTARKIHEEFLGDEEFTITEYSWWQHSVGANVCKFTGVVATSFLLVLVADTLITKYR